jgi:hypothetical protein
VWSLLKILIVERLMYEETLTVFFIPFNFFGKKCGMDLSENDEQN